MSVRPAIPDPWCWGCLAKVDAIPYEVVVTWVDGDVELVTQHLSCHSYDCAQVLAVKYAIGDRKYKHLEVRTRVT